MGTAKSTIIFLRKRLNFSQNSAPFWTVFKIQLDGMLSLRMPSLEGIFFFYSFCLVLCRDGVVRHYRCALFPALLRAVSTRLRIPSSISSGKGHKADKIKDCVTNLFFDLISQRLHRGPERYSPSIVHVFNNSIG